jgi:hypothetical protein
MGTYYIHESEYISTINSEKGHCLVDSLSHSEVKGRGGFAYAIISFFVVFCISMFSSSDLCSYTHFTLSYIHLDGTKHFFWRCLVDSVSGEPYFIEKFVEAVEHGLLELEAKDVSSWKTTEYRVVKMKDYYVAAPRFLLPKDQGVCCDCSSVWKYEK